MRHLLGMATEMYRSGAGQLQEEYHASFNMYLLIPYTPALIRKTSVFGTLLSELKVRVITLRRELTRFALAYRNNQRFNLSKVVPAP